MVHFAHICAYGVETVKQESSKCTLNFFLRTSLSSLTKYKLGYVKRGSTTFKVQKDGCGVPSAARALLGPEGLLMR